MTIMIVIVFILSFVFQGFAAGGEIFDQKDTSALAAKRVAQATCAFMEKRTNVALQELALTGGVIATDLIQETRDSAVFLNMNHLQPDFSKTWSPAIARITPYLMPQLLKVPSARKAFESAIVHSRLGLDFIDEGIMDRLRNYESLIIEVDRLYKRSRDRREAVAFFIQVAYDILTSVLGGVSKSFGGERALEVMSGEPELKTFLEQWRKPLRGDAYPAALHKSAWDMGLRYVLLQSLDQRLLNYVSDCCSHINTTQDGKVLYEQSLKVAQGTLNELWARTKEALKEMDCAQSVEHLGLDLQDFYSEDIFSTHERDEIVLATREVSQAFQSHIMAVPEVHASMGEVLRYVGKNTFDEDRVIIECLARPAGVMTGVLRLEKRALARNLAVRNLERVLLQVLRFSRHSMTGMAGRAFLALCSQPVLRPIMHKMVHTRGSYVIATLLRESVKSALKK